jgi:hypothetical protein
MHPFRVWIRPMGDFCRVRVDGIGNAQWLLQRLGGSFVFATFEPIHELANSTCCTFEVPYNPPLSRAGFQRLLTGIPEVQLMREPA